MKMKAYRGGDALVRGLAALLLALLAQAASAAAPQCKLVRIAEWSVQIGQGLPVIEGAINGQKVGILLDTGAFASLVTKDAADRLGLTTRESGEIMLGVGGRSRVLLTRINELKIGKATRENLRVRVGGEVPIPGVDFILGDDFFREVDMEFDYARQTIRLFRPIDCGSASLAYWDPKALQVPMERDGKIVVAVKINGTPARALLDSGASASVVSRPFAERLGIGPGKPEVLPAGCTFGLGADRVRQWVARFDTVEIAEQTTRDARLNIADVMPEAAFGTNAVPEVILGTDFLRAHRVLVSRSQRKVYFSYAGGLVFPTIPRLDCEEEAPAKDLGELRAAYDRAIADNPRNADARIRRSALAWREGGAKAALPDLDAALAAEPANPVALSMRADARASLGEYEGALADSEAAIANGMRTSRVHVMRAGVRRSQGDLPKAIEEYGEALKLDPRSVGALRSRGRYLYHSARYEDAELDFASLLALRASPFDSMWLSLARMRRGLDAAPALEQGLSRLGDAAQWPAPVMRHLLGRLDRPGLMAAAADPDPVKRKERECEARYYSAARLRIAGDEAQARPLLEQSADQCPRTFIEYDSALLDLEDMR